MTTDDPTKYPKLSDLISKISESPPMAFERFTNLSDAPNEEPWVSIKEFYSHSSPGVRGVGIILNGAITNKKTTFLLSYNIFNQWLRANNEPSVSGSSFKKILAQITDPKLGLIRCVTKSSVQGSNSRRAGTYEVIGTSLLHYIE